VILLLLVKPALVVTVALAVTALLRHRTAALRHAVWTGAILSILALGPLSLLLPPLRLAAPIAAPVTRSTSKSAPALRARAATPSASARPRATPLARAPLTVRLPPLLLAIWIAGVLVSLGRRLGSQIGLSRIVARAQPMRTRFATAADVRLSAELHTPAVAGVLRPVVVLPAAAMDWPAADLEAVLAHEIGHVTRRDGVFNLCGDLARAIYWCNPLVHLAVRRLRVESERACDDRVLSGGSAPERYAHLLLAIAHTAQRDGNVPSAALAMARPKELESRLLAVLDDRLPRAPLRSGISATLAAAAVILAVPTAAFTLQAAVLGEPDTFGDSLASPLSERLPRAPEVSPAAALRGPDSALARTLLLGLAHQPDGPADLVRERAAWALAQADAGRLIEPLLAALDAPDWRVQSYAAWSLALAHDPRAAPRLIPLLRHPVWRLRAMAAAALRSSLDPRAEAAMDAALTDPAWQVRVEAVEYFAARGAPGLDARLGPRRNDRHAAVRHAAALALTSR
jgi:beta-lactamase regulating signal transducer with metallopeptidase domain